MREQSRSDEDLGVRYLRMALEYGRATRALLDGNQCEAPFWQSMGHALELSLKSLLKSTASTRWTSCISSVTIFMGLSGPTSGSARIPN